MISCPTIFSKTSRCEKKVGHVTNLTINHWTILIDFLEISLFDISQMGGFGSMLKVSCSTTSLPSFILAWHACCHNLALFWIHSTTWTSFWIYSTTSFSTWLHSTTSTFIWICFTTLAWDWLCLTIPTFYWVSSTMSTLIWVCSTTLATSNSFGTSTSPNFNCSLAITSFMVGPSLDIPACHNWFFTFPI